MDVEFELKTYSGLARSGQLTAGTKIVSTPIVFLGYRLGDKPRAWRSIRIQSLMPNAYDLLRNDRRSRDVLEHGIHNFLDYNGLVMMDSGGYYFQKEGKVSVNVDTVLNLYEKSLPDIGVVLDFPLNPSDPTTNLHRIKKTGENTKVMLQDARIPMMPTIHGYTEKDIDYSARFIDKETQMLALGSQAALLYPFRADKIIKIMRIVLYVRTKFPNSFLHVFGLGSPRLMPLAFYSGADSVDAKTWLWKAVRHMIYYNGQIVCIKPDTYSWTPVFDGKGYKCECPVCSEEGFQGLLGKENWPKRGLHNAWKYQQEIQNVQTSIKEGTLEDYVRRRLEGTPFMSTFRKMKRIVSDKDLTNHLGSKSLS